MGSSPIVWLFRKKSTVTTSIIEAEYNSTIECIRKVLLIKNLLLRLFGYKETITIYTDNEANKTSIESGQLNPKLIHIAVKFPYQSERYWK